jgi:hypothetical protein
MPPDRRTLRDIRNAYEGMKQYQVDVGEWVQWFRYNQAASTSHPVYSTGPNRQWYPPITLPVVIGEYQRARRNRDDDGLYQVDRVHAICSYDAFFHTTMPDPDPNGADHVKDRVAFDGKLFSVEAFSPAGRVASYFLTISIDLVEVALEDLDEDFALSMWQQYISAS